MAEITDVRPRRLTREERRARTREDLLQAAAEVFGKRGYHGASLDEVAEAAGYTKGAVYSNFGSKEELFLEVADRRVASLVNMLLEVFREAKPNEILLNLFETAHNFANADNFILLDMEFRLYARRHPEAREKLATRDSAMLQGLGDLLDQHFKSTGVKPALPPLDIARAVWGLADGLSLQGATDPSVMENGLPEKALRTLVAGAGVSLPPLSSTQNDKPEAPVEASAAVEGRTAAEGETRAVPTASGPNDSSQ